jgi:hypothetical protein
LQRAEVVHVGVNDHVTSERSVCHHRGADTGRPSALVALVAYQQDSVSMPTGDKIYASGGSGSVRAF